MCNRCNKKPDYWNEKNNMIPDEVPDKLKDLTYMEVYAISRIVPHFIIWTVKCMGTKFKGNMITFPKDVLCIINKLPHIPDENDI